MSRSFLSFVGVRRILLLAILLGLMTGWTATAFAQTSAEGQYASPTSTPSGNPAESGNFASTGSFTNIEGENGAEEVALGSGGGGAEEVALGSRGGSGASESGGRGGVSVGVLPATGGPLTLFVVLGILALGSTGLLAFRRVTYR